MKVYLNVSCLNRPFDDQEQARIRLEAAAVGMILERVDEDEDEGRERGRHAQRILLAGQAAIDAGQARGGVEPPPHAQMAGKMAHRVGRLRSGALFQAVGLEIVGGRRRAVVAGLRFREVLRQERPLPQHRAELRQRQPVVVPRRRGLVLVQERQRGRLVLLDRLVQVVG